VAAKKKKSKGKSKGKANKDKAKASVSKDKAPAEAESAPADSKEASAGKKDKKAKKAKPTPEERRAHGVSIFLAMLSGCLWFLACADFDIWPFAYIAMLPAFWVVERAPTRRKALFYGWLGNALATCLSRWLSWASCSWLPIRPWSSGSSSGSCARFASRPASAWERPCRWCSWRLS
jgi:hypothetical protein